MKELLVYYAQALPVFFYWISLALIGYVALRFLFKKINTPWGIVGIQGNILLRILISFAAGVGLVSIVSLIGYAFNLPSIVFTVVYSVMCLVSVVYVIPGAIRALRRKKEVRIGGGRFWIFTAIAVGTLALLAFDYLVSAYWGAQFAEGSDSYVHVAKILSIATYGFSLDDGFMAGVLETRYHFNAIYPLYLPIIHLLNISPADAWNLSTGFFRLIQWIAIGALAGFLYARFIKTKIPVGVFSCIAVIAAVALFTSKWYLHVATYPNKIVILWFILLVIGFILYVSRLKKERSAGLTLMYGGAALATLTHPTYALMAAVFVFAAAILLLLGDIVKWWKWSWRDALKTLGVFGVLMLAPLVAISFPDRMTQQSFDFGGFKTVDVLGVEVLPVYIPDSVPAVVVSLLALAGYALLVTMAYKKRNYAVVLILMLLVAFPFLTLHNPLFMLIVGDRLPLWLVARFSAMNILMFVSLLFGVYALYLGVAKLRLAKPLRYALFVVLTTAVLAGVAFNTLNGYRTLRDYTKGIDHGYLAFIQRTQEDLKDVMPAGSIVYANIGDSYFLPAVIPVKVLAIHDAHATPMADSKERLSCSEEILKTGYDTQLLATAGIEYIVLAKWEVTFPQLMETLKGNSRDFSFVKETRDFFVYKVNTQSLGQKLKSGSCYEYQRNEDTLQK